MEKAVIESGYYSAPTGTSMWMIHSSYGENKLGEFLDQRNIQAPELLRGGRQNHFS